MGENGRVEVHPFVGVEIIDGEGVDLIQQLEVMKAR